MEAWGGSFQRQGKGIECGIEVSQEERNPSQSDPRTKFHSKKHLSVLLRLCGVPARAPYEDGHSRAALPLSFRLWDLASAWLALRNRPRSEVPTQPSQHFAACQDPDSWGRGGDKE